MAEIDAQQVDLDGTDPTFAAASAGGDKFKPGDDVLLYVKNGSGVEVTATIVTPGEVVGQAVGDVAVAVPAGEERVIGPFPRDHFVGSDGLADVTWSATTSVTFAVLKA